jgi:hypothetical protein
MITSVATFSLDQARKYLGRKFHAGHTEPGQHRLWIGFDTNNEDQSPLRYQRDGAIASLVIRAEDFDGEPRTCAFPPTIAHARELVRFVLASHAAPLPLDLCVHCHAGLFRSGAVAEWVRLDLGIPEHEASNRLVGVLGSREDRTYNVTLLRFLREAHAETLR